MAPKNMPLFENYIFCIAKPNGKRRVIFDMKTLNTHIRLPKLRMFTFDKGYQEFHRNLYATRIDLSNAFWHIGVNPKFKQYLAFNFDNIKYWWNVMPFGLRTAPYLFCKFMNTIIVNIREKFDIVVYFYMDDVLVVAPSKELCLKYVNIVIEELQKAGLTINFQKSCLEPASSIVFLGVDLNLKGKTMAPSRENVIACIDKVNNFLSPRPKTLLHFQSLVGSLNFAAAYIQCGKLMLSPIFRFYAYFNNERARPVPEELKSLLNFWKSEISYQPIDIPNLIAKETTLFTDASNVGWGAQIKGPDDDVSYVQGTWDEE